MAERAVRAGRAATAEDAAAARVRFDADRWFAARLLPKVFGDRIEHGGSVDVNVGLADRLEAARKRLLAADGSAVIDGVALPATEASQPEPADPDADNGDGAVGDELSDAGAQD